MAKAHEAARLFIAVWPDDVTRDALAARQGAWRWPSGASLVPPAKLHLTLHFLGNVAVGRVPALVASLRQVPFEPFVLDLADARLWPGGIAVLRQQHTPAPLLALHGRLGEALRRLEMPVELRQYKAHVTLARRAAGATPPPQAPAVRWAAGSGYVLVRSLPDGGAYELLERFS